MIALMRRLIHSNVYKLFLWAFLFMMAFGSGVAFINFGESRDWVLKVYKDTMTQDKFQAMLKQAKQQQEMYRQKGYALADNKVAKETVQGAVGMLLAQHTMKNLGLVVPTSLVQTQFQHQLQQLPSYFFTNGELDQEAFKRLIAPHTIEDFLVELELDAKNKLLFGLVDAGIYISNFEVALQYNGEFADKNYSYILFGHQKYLDKVRLHTPSDETLAKFYKKPSVADGFRTLERRAGTIWVFDPADFGITLSDNDIKQFYDKHKMQRYVIDPVQMQVRTLLIKVEPTQEAQAKAKIEELSAEAHKDPAQFETLVKKFSQDSKSVARGGLSEFFAKDDKKVDPMIIDIAFEFLTTDGQISAPIKTAQGYELVQRVQKKPATYKDLKSVQAEIKKELLGEKFKKRFVQDAARVCSNAKYNPESLKKFIERYKGVAVEIPMEVRKSGIEYNYLFKVEEGRYASYINKDKGAIILCSKVEKSRLPALQEVKSQVLNVYFEDQAKELISKQLSEAFEQANRMNLQDVADKYGLTVQKASFTFKNGKPELSAVLKDSEVQAKIKSMQHVGALAALQAKGDGILLKLDSIASQDSDLFNEQKSHLNKVMFYMRMYQIKDGFIASLYRTAKLNNKIEIKNELLQLTKEV